MSLLLLFPKMMFKEGEEYLVAWACSEPITSRKQTAAGGFWCLLQKTLAEQFHNRLLALPG